VKNYQLLECWEKKIKVTLNELQHNANKQTKDVKVTYRQELANRYLGNFVSCSDIAGYINLLKDKDIKIIDKNRSVILTCNGKAVGAVIRDVALKPVSNHFGAKMKVTVKAHYPLNRGKEHSSFGTMVGHGIRENITTIPTFNYSYNKKLGPNAQKIFDNDGNTLAKWLFENSKRYIPFATSSYEEFKAKVELDNDNLIGAVFCAKNYEAAGHIDDDRSEYAIGYVYKEGTVKEGHFFYPEYGVAIEMTSNSIWC
jgi:hypothetical protein